MLAGHRGDDHQDHRELARLVPTVFRDHLALGYEILKAEPDLAQPAAALAARAATSSTRRSGCCTSTTPRRSSRSWFDDEAFRGLARIRGVQAGGRYAEGFHPTRLLVGAPT